MHHQVDLGEDGAAIIPNFFYAFTGFEEFMIFQLGLWVEGPEVLNLNNM